jgi:GDP-L-fucose synthase
MNGTQSPRSQRLNCATPIADSIGDDFISVMPTNLLPSTEQSRSRSSHSTFSRSKLGTAPEVTVRGSGKPRREFMAADDAADARIFVMKY